MANLTHIPTIAERAGALLTRYLTGPERPRTSWSNPELEEDMMESWKDSIGKEAATLWAEAVGRDPEALRIIEVIQHVAGFVPASRVAIPATVPSRREYVAKLPEIFAQVRTWR
jgi:hypothetical protein